MEVYLMDDANFPLTPDQLWKTLLNNIKGIVCTFFSVVVNNGAESFLMGCSKEDSHAKAESAHTSGLLINHAYPRAAQVVE